jgi:hypothetical protein
MIKIIFTGKQNSLSESHQGGKNTVVVCERNMARAAVAVAVVVVIIVVVGVVVVVVVVVVVAVAAAAAVVVAVVVFIGHGVAEHDILRRNKRPCPIE